MRLFRFKTKYILRTEYDPDGVWPEYDPDGVWTKATVDDVFDRNPNITDAHAAFATYSWIEEFRQYGPPPFRRCAYRLAVYKQRGSRMRLIQVEQIPPVRWSDLTNVKWPRP
jgi:hypothetical protein